ncbi:MAG: hypothetical protein HC773_25075 [Scytonema sp. CRU_2_7]|nr:hypothetical protein [Scytonema sp. CRU_2_7]
MNIRNTKVYICLCKIQVRNTTAQAQNVTNPVNQQSASQPKTEDITANFIHTITEKFSLSKVGIGLFRFGIGYSFLIVIAWVCLLVIVELGLNDVDPQLVIQIQDFLLTTGRPAVVTTPALMTAYSIFKQVIPQSPVIEQLAEKK